MASPQTCPLNFIVVGGSIAGLVSAYQLAQNGHKVLILEKDPPSASRGGLRLPPNATRLLETMPGVRELLRSKGTICRDLTIVEGTSFHVLGRLSYDPQCVTDLLGNFWTIPYDTLHDHLTQICRLAGVHIVYHVQVASVIPGDRPVVVSAAGQSFSADIVVGADGRFSVTRAYVNQDPEPIYADDEDMEEDEDDGASLYSAYRPRSSFPTIHATRGWTFCISRERMRSDPILDPLWQNNLIGWPGTGMVVLGHPCGPDAFIMTAVRICDPSEPLVDGHFQLNQPYEDFNDYFKQFDPRLRRLAKMAHTVHTTTQTVPRFTRFADRNSRVVLIGDAAHGSPIHCTHHCALAIEDAFTLARIFAHITARAHIPLFLHGYNQSRMARVAAVEASEFESIHQVMLPPGPQRESRDASLAATLLINEDEQMMSDEDFAAAWHTYARQLDFDAADAAEGWWLNYGRYALEQEYGVPVEGEGVSGVPIENGVGVNGGDLDAVQARVVAQIA
ncbi:hypothetical protein GGG16DRAFT_111985 [Schizophyllum commune]